MAKYEFAEKFAEQFEDVPNFRMYAVVNGSFIFGEIIEAIARKVEIETLYISTLSLSCENVDSLVNVMQGTPNLKNVTIIVSHYFYAHERNSLVAYLLDQLDIDGRLDFVVASLHCKIVAFKTSTGNHFTMHGSANLPSLWTMEQVQIEESKELYDFNVEIFERIADDYRITQKPARLQRTLW